ncbi:Protein of unknown function [Propionibacterium freudenreichii]|nr:Protein of unknown function [Propionibacterium freudenreichii]
MSCLKLSQWWIERSEPTEE